MIVVAMGVSLEPSAVFVVSMGDYLDCAVVLSVTLRVDLVWWGHP